MRFSRVLATTTGLLPALSSLASAAYLPPATRSVNPLLDPRDLSVEAHVCVDLDTTISVVALSIIEIDIEVQVCLCVDAVVEYVNGRSDIPQDCRDDASKKIANQIKNHPSAVQCYYPSHCKPTSPTCSSSNKCACECEPGYTRNPTTGKCECGAGTYDCHGECRSNSSPCPSAVPRRARSANGQTAKRDDENANRIAHGRGPLCPHGQTVCGVEMRGGTSMRGWECVNTQTDLESCGGCAIPFSSSSIPGTDCSQIPHVADVSCEASSCRVRRCAKGYAVSRDESTCVPVSLRSLTEATNSSRRGYRQTLHHTGSK